MTDVQIPGSSVGKFQVIEGYLPISPNKCMACGSFHGTFIDFGLNDDWYGAVYFCSDCVTGMAAVLGYVPSSEKDKFIAKIDEYVEKIKELEKEKNVYRDALAGMDAFMRGTSHPSISNSTNVEELSTKGEEQLTLDFESSGDEQGSVESDDVQGPPSIRNNDSLDEFLDTI